MSKNNFLITSSDKVGADLTADSKIIDLAEQAGVKKVALLSIRQWVEEHKKEFNA